MEELYILEEGEILFFSEDYSYYKRGWSLKYIRSEFPNDKIEYDDDPTRKIFHFEGKTFEGKKFYSKFKDGIIKYVDSVSILRKNKIDLIFN